MPILKKDLIIFLFARDPSDVARGAAVQLVRRSGTGPGTVPSIERTECAGPLAETIACCMDFISRHGGRLWLNQLGADGLGRNEARALVAARRGGGVTPRALRAGMPDADIDAMLARMVSKGLLRRVGVRGGSRYVLSDTTVARAGRGPPDDRQTLLDEIRHRGSLSSAEGAMLIDRDVAYARSLLNELVAAGLVRAEGRTRARRYHPD